MASLDPSPIPSVPPPWTLKGTVYTFMLYVPTKQISTIPHSFLSSPLEKDSLLLKAGEYLGGLASVQIIRYTETPVGPYDELLLVPGKFSYEKENKKGIKEKKENLRITKIFVSQKYTCFNGRKSKFLHFCPTSPHPHIPTSPPLNPQTYRSDSILW